jgi:hypothetical protein
MFGGAMRGRANPNAVKRGAAIHTQVSIPFMDAVNGTTRQVTVFANVRVPVWLLDLPFVWTGHGMWQLLPASPLALRGAWFD